MQSTLSTVQEYDVFWLTHRLLYSLTYIISCVRQQQRTGYVFHRTLVGFEQFDAQQVVGKFTIHAFLFAPELCYSCCAV